MKLVWAARERIPLDLQEFSSLLPESKLMERLIDRLYENWFVAREFGRWAVEVWANILKTKSGEKNENVFSPSSHSSKKTSHQLLQELWHSHNEIQWRSALEQYWVSIQYHHLNLELYMNRLYEKVRKFSDIQDWSSFLTEHYFRWLFTVPQYYEENVKCFRAAYENHSKSLDTIIQGLFLEYRQGIREEKDV